MSFQNSNNNSPNEFDIFLKCLSKFYQSEFESEGLNYRRLKLRDSVVKAYNEKFKTKLKGFELLTLLKQNEKSYQPYEWQKLFLDVFNDENDESSIHKNQVKSAEILQNIKKENDIETENVHQEALNNIKDDVPVKSSCQVECSKPDIPIAAQDINYKTMSTYELKRALLISKLEMLDAQEALRRAKENIRLNEKEYVKRGIDKQ